MLLVVCADTATSRLVSVNASSVGASSRSPHAGGAGVATTTSENLRELPGWPLETPPALSVSEPKLLI